MAGGPYGVGGGNPSPPMTEEERLEYARVERQRRLKRNYGQLNYGQRQALSVMGARVWLLQGPDLVRRNMLNPDLFLKITSFVVRLPVHDVQQVFHAVNMRLFNDIDTKIGKGFGFFQSSKKIEAKRRVAIERCETRMKF